MIRNYLRTLYSSRIVSLNIVQQELTSWQIVNFILIKSNSMIQKKYQLESFEKAVEFVTIGNNYTNNMKIEANL